MPKTRNWQWYIEKQSEHEAHMHAITRTIYSGNTKFQNIGIVESPVHGKMLILDGDTQSAQADEFIYHESLVHPALILHSHPKNILILGGGEGATLREILAHKTVEKVVMIDIDKDVIELSKKYLPEWSEGAFDNPKVKTIYMDARKYLEETKDIYDVIISDLTEPLPDGPSHKLFTREFFKIVKNHLTPDGIFALQASKADYHYLKLHAIIYKTVKSVFKTTYSFAARVPAFDTMWGFIISSDRGDLMQVTKEEIDSRISKRVERILKYYDGTTHQHLFSLPRYHREKLDEETEILADARPLVAIETGTIF